MARPLLLSTLVLLAIAAAVHADDNATAVGSAGGRTNEWCSWHQGSRSNKEFADPNHNGFEKPYPYNWCSHGDGGDDLSCTPFQYRPSVTPDYKTFAQGGTPERQCKAGNWDIQTVLTGSANSKDQFSTTRSWAFHDAQGNVNDDNMFVFHGCDGAGIMQDCVGDWYYVERMFKPVQQQGQKIKCDGGTTLMENIPSLPYNPRRQCEFHHPGLDVTYSSYYASSPWGVYGPGASIKKDYFASAWSGTFPGIVNELMKATNPFPVEAVGFILYPWVCGYDPDQDATADGKKPFNSEFVQDVKCWWDNEVEPKDGPNRQPPPVIQIFWARVHNPDSDKDVWLEMKGSYLDYSQNPPKMAPLGNPNGWPLKYCDGACAIHS